MHYFIEFTFPSKQMRDSPSFGKGTDDDKAKNIVTGFIVKPASAATAAEARGCGRFPPPPLWFANGGCPLGVRQWTDSKTPERELTLKVL